MIICSGDSYTDANFKSTIVPDYDTSYPKWPALLDFDEEVVNVGGSGACNQWIVRSAYKEAKKHDNVSKIFLGLSDWTRFLVFFRRFNPQLWTNPKLRNMSELEKEIAKQTGLLGELSEIVLSDIALEWFLDQTLDNLHMLWDYCKFRDIELIVFQMLAPVGVDEKYNTKFYKALLNDQRFIDLKEVSIGWPYTKRIYFEGRCVFEEFIPEKHHILPKIDAHPNAQGHQRIASYVMLGYEAMKKQSGISNILGKGN